MVISKPTVMTLALAALAGVLIVIGFIIRPASSSVEDYFNVTIPKEAEYLATDINLLTVDGSAAWLIKVSSPIDLVPEGFAEVQFSEDKHSKHQEVQESLTRIFPADLHIRGPIRIFVGGPGGNSFIGVSQEGSKVYFFRFWT